MKIYINYSLTLLSILILFACNKEWDLSYQPTFEENYCVVKEVPTNDTILLIEQGGPSDKLSDKDDINDIIAFFPYTIYLMHQGQTKDPSILDQAHLTDEDAELINDISTDILAQTIDSLKKEGKHVLVFGGSYGCFLGLRTLHRHGNTADKYVLSIGRVSFPPEFYEIFRNRKFGIYALGQHIVEDKHLRSKQLWATAVMLGNVGKYDYTILLDGYDLSNLLFVGRIEDANVGRLTDKEISFLEKHNAKVVEFPGVHVLDENDFREMLAFFRK